MMGSGVTPLLITVSEAKDVPFRADPFIVVEAGGARTQTDVIRDTTAPVWDQMFTLRADFSAGTREELKVLAWHEDVYEDQLLGRITLEIEGVLHRREVLEQWVMLLDERGLRATGMELLIRVENGKAPPLSELCASDEISLSEVERTISQDPSQCGEREVNTRTGMLCLHTLLANQVEWPDEVLALLLKCNHKQARVADRHGNLPLHYLCKRFGLTERQLAMLIKCSGDAAKAPNRYGKLPLHFLARNPSLTRPMLALLVEAYPGATTARDQSGSLPLHYVAQNPSLSKETLQSFLAACGQEGSKEAAEAADKYGNVPLRHLVTSTAFTDQHLRVMLRANDRAVQVKDRYGNPPLEYLAFNREVSGFQQQVATEARRAIDRSEVMVSDVEGAGRVVGGATALRLLMGVQKYALFFHDFSLAEVRSLVHGLKGQRMLVTRFAKGDVLVRRGEAATFFGLLLEGELGLRAVREAGGGGGGGGFPRRLHRGSLFGHRGLFDQGLRTSDVVAVSEGHVATLLYSEVELLGGSFPDVMRKLNLQLAKADIEQRLSETDMSLDDLGDAELQRQASTIVVKELLKQQHRGQWGAQHAALLALREGIYADILDEAAAREVAAAARDAANGKASRVQVDRGVSQVKAMFARSQAPGRTDRRRGSVSR